MEDPIQVELLQIIRHEKTAQQYIYLREHEGERTFPIVIGYPEVFEIERKLKGNTSDRPFTHDLIGNLIRGLDYHLDRVVITELRHNTFYAELVLTHIQDPGDERRIDSRPSDAIALAVQLRAPIYVSREVLDAVTQN